MSSLKDLKLAIVCPCFNEEELLASSVYSLYEFLDILIEKKMCSDGSFIVLVDDGSEDSTWDKIKLAAAKHPTKIRGIKLAFNSGHQNAIMAGMTYVAGYCDAVVTMDIDLQDDLNAIPVMLEKHASGAEIILGVKLSRTGDSIFKKATARIYYKLMQYMGVDLIPNHADFRLLSRQALNNLMQYQEKALFLRGLQPLIHKNIATVHYHISNRMTGVSKYTFSKMLSLAADGITSFSIRPLRMIFYMGAGVFVISSMLAIFSIISYLQGNVLPGWASITVPIYVLGGIVMLSIGVLGEYIARIFTEVKNRPRFIIDKLTDLDTP